MKNSSKSGFLRRITASACIYLLSMAAIYSQLSMSEIFSDHMVIQRSQPINFWGNATPGDQVSMTFNGSTINVITDKEGNWKVTYPPMKAGGPFNAIVASSGSSKITLNDIYIGDVWLCSGQSNMEWIVEYSLKAEQAVNEATDKMIRHIKVPHAYADDPDSDLPECHWVVNSPESVSEFTAVGYYFAQALRKHHNVPIGLLNSSWGGSRIEPWMSAESLGAEDAAQVVSEMKRKALEVFNERQRELNKIFPGLGTDDAGIKGDEALWAAPEFNDNDWMSLHIPQMWEEQGLGGFDGVGWYRIKIALSEKEVGKDATLRLAKIDDSDQVWINGHYIGGVSQAYDKIREYAVKPGLLLPGENVITVRVEDTGGGGGIYGEDSDLFLEIGNTKIPLSGKHKFNAGSILSLSPTINANQTPTLLYNKMIHPILSFPIKGVIWYQGESNTRSNKDAEEYRTLFMNMIKDWRHLWNQPDLPFLFVQLANFMQPDDNPAESHWAVLRESQHAALQLKNVGEAVIIDLGEADDIHPRNKHDVGYRLSLPARKLAYGEDLVFSGPEPVTHEVKGNQVVIGFDQHLVVRDKYGYVNGFAIAGNDGNYHWAKAMIKDNQITIWNDTISIPRHVRYGWANNPDDLNLYNKEGLPVSPFRIEVTRNNTK